MKQAMKNITSQFSGFLGGSKTITAPVPAKIKPRSPSSSELTIAKYSGEPSIVARHVAWGVGRAWPRDETFEQKIPKLFNLTANKIVGVLGCGSGASLIELSKHLPTFVHGYDWRADVEVAGEELIRKLGKSAKVRIRSMCLDVVISPDVRCHAIVAIEPVLTRAQPKIFDWLRLALVNGGQAVLVEPSLEQGGSGSENSWFGDVEGKDCFWQSPGERSNALKEAGFEVRKVRETTGSYVRSLRQSLEKAYKSQLELDSAIKLAPILEPVRDFFKFEVEFARKRLQALETGSVAVYCYQVIKQRADD